MTYLDRIIEAVIPQPQPTLGPADLQHKKQLVAIEAAKQKQADETRRRDLNARLADEDRRKFTEKRDAIVNARKRDGKPMQHAELHVLDCEIELRLAELAYGRDPGQPRKLGDGNLEMSRQKARVAAAKRALKSAEDALDRVVGMTAATQPQTYTAPVDVRGYTDHKIHMQQVLASHGKK